MLGVYLESSSIGYQTTGCSIGSQSSCFFFRGKQGSLDFPAKRCNLLVASIEMIATSWRFQKGIWRRNHRLFGEQQLACKLTLQVEKLTSQGKEAQIGYVCVFLLPPYLWFSKGKPFGKSTVSLLRQGKGPNTNFLPCDLVIFWPCPR